VIMEENLRMAALKSIAMHMAFNKSFHPPSLLSRIVEKKNRVIQEMARVMIHSKNLAQHFWGEAVNTTCYIINQ
jgi:hypothetical protein